MKKTLSKILYYTGINLLYNNLRGRHIILVGYHSVSREENKKELDADLYKHLSVPFEAFRSEVLYLRDNGYQFINFKMLKDAHDGAFDIGKKTAIIYFDDGFKDNYINAYPLLKELGVPAVVFPAVDFIEKRGIYPWIKKDPQELNFFLSWDELKKMTDVFEIGTHTMSHSKLTKLPLDVVRAELTDSRRVIEEKTGTKVVALSYPKSDFNGSIQNIAREAGFWFTVGNGRGPDQPHKIHFKKIPTRPDDTLIDFKVKVGIWYPLLNKLKFLYGNRE